MTKHENREILNIENYIKAGMHDTAARSLSALIRAARTSTSKANLMIYARAWNLTTRPDFII